MKEHEASDKEQNEEISLNLNNKSYEHGDMNLSSSNASLEKSDQTNIDHENDDAYDPEEDTLATFLDNNPEYAVLIRDEGLLGYRFKGVLKNPNDENSKLRSARALKKNTPMLEFFIIDQDGQREEVPFPLPRNVVEDLAEKFTTLEKAYKGTLYTNSDEELKNNWKDFLEYVSTHKVVSALVAVIVVLFVVGIFVL